MTEFWKELKEVKPGKWYNALNYKKEFSDLMLEDGTILFYGWCNAGKFTECITGKGEREVYLEKGMKIRSSCYSI